MFTIADIGSKRLEKVLVKDKTEDPKRLAEVGGQAVLGRQAL